jgi:hypothetical protein
MAQWVAGGGLARFSCKTRLNQSALILVGK